MAAKKPAPVAAIKSAPINAHSVPVHTGDGRKIAPGQPIPADITGDTLKALLATGFFA